MSVPQYFAQIDDNNIVTSVHVVTRGFLEENPERYPGVWVETFVDVPTKKYAAIGYTYNAVADVFIAPKPFASWLLDENYDWQAPIDYPADGKFYSWDESNQVWVEVPAI